MEEKKKERTEEKKRKKRGIFLKSKGRAGPWKQKKRKPTLMFGLV
jgi:hypothetical protein